MKAAVKEHKIKLVDNATGDNISVGMRVISYCCAISRSNSNITNNIAYFHCHHGGISWKLLFNNGNYPFFIHAEVDLVHIDSHM